jgi:hypothetical protein
VQTVAYHLTYMDPRWIIKLMAEKSPSEVLEYALDRHDNTLQVDFVDVTLIILFDTPTTAVSILSFFVCFFDFLFVCLFVFVLYCLCLCCLCLCCLCLCCLCLCCLCLCCLCLCCLCLCSVFV